MKNIFLEGQSLNNHRKILKTHAPTKPIIVRKRKTELDDAKNPIRPMTKTAANRNWTALKTLKAFLDTTLDSSFFI